MKIEIDIVDDKLQGLSSSANTEICKVTKLYVEEILDEASRIEESRRTSVQNPEITASIINDAVYLAKNIGIRKRKPKRHVVMQTIVFLSSTITGGLFDIDKFKNLGFIILFLIVFFVAISTTIYLILNDNNND